MFRGAAALVVLLAAAVGACGPFDPEVGDPRPACADVDSDPSKSVSFANDIRPLMSGAVGGTKGCKNCHYPSTGTREGFNATGLSLETLGEIRRGGRSTPPGAILVPGRPCSSAIVQKLQGTFGGARMPKEGPFWTPEKIQLVVDWIAEGARGADTE